MHESFCCLILPEQAVVVLLANCFHGFLKMVANGYALDLFNQSVHTHASTNQSARVVNLHSRVNTVKKKNKEKKRKELINTFQ